MESPELERATLMLRIAAEFIREHCPDQTIFYDGTECDGYCVAADCDNAAADLGIDDGFEG